MKVMMVDDHAEMRRLLRSILSDLASELTECADGAEAVAAFARQRPDWTIMDITMKGMNGLEAPRRIQKQFAGSRIVVLTQHDTRKCAPPPSKLAPAPSSPRTTSPNSAPFFETNYEIQCHQLSRDRSARLPAPVRGHVAIDAVEAQAASVANAPVLKSAAIQGGAFWFSYTNLPIADFTVLCSTNLSQREILPFKTRPVSTISRIPKPPITHSDSTRSPRRNSIHGANGRD